MVERDSDGLCVCVCVQCIESGGTRKSIKCVKTDVIKWSAFPSCSLRCSITTIGHVVYHREGGRSSSQSLFMWALATACKTLP